MAEDNSQSQRPNAKPARSRGPAGWSKIIAGALITVALIIWFGLWFYHRTTHVSEDDARVVSTEVTVSSRLAGQVTVFSRIGGDRLKHGDVIAQLYNKPDQLELERLKARVKEVEAQASYERRQIKLARQQFEGGIEVTKGQLQTDRAAAAAAKATLENARSTYERSKRLFESGTVSVQKTDHDHYAYEAAKAAYQRAERQVAVDRSALSNAHNGVMAGPQMTLPKPDLLQAKLDVTLQSLAEARAALKHQALRVHDRVVRSPIDGVVDKTFVDPGEYVSAGQPLLMMHAPHDVWIEAKVKETKVRLLKIGQPVDITVDAYPDLTFTGHVRVIGHAATAEFALLPDPNPSGNFTKITQRIPVRIAIDQGPRERLSPGMMVETDIDISGDR